MVKSKDWIVRVTYSVTLSFSSDEPVDEETAIRVARYKNLNKGHTLTEVDNSYAYLVSTEPVGEVIEQDSTD